jgi:paraquat-inducible protein A
VSTSTHHLWLTRTLLLLSAVLLGLGLVAPCMTIVPSMGEFDGWVRLLKPDMLRATEYSILGGILSMIAHGNVGIGVLLLAFSGVFPVVKLFALMWGSESAARGLPEGRLARFAHHAGKWSMLDVLVLGLLVLAIKGLPGNTRIELGWGVYAFAASVVLGLVVTGLSRVANREVASRES